MKLKKPCLKLFSIGAIVLLTSACASGERFEWGNYDLALYQYSKSPEKMADYELALTRAIAQGKATNRLAPGLLAELGYLKLEKGDTGQAVALFREEAMQFPASAAFLNGTIARLTTESKPTS